MIITDVGLKLFRWEGRDTGTFGTGHSIVSSPDVAQLGLLTVTTDEGIEGHSFLGTGSMGANFDGPTLLRYLKPVVMGRDPLDRAALSRAMWDRRRYAPIRTIGAVDVALWDIAAKAAGQPLYKYLGAYRDTIPAYASSMHHPTPEGWAEEALSFKSRGWRAYKIHPPARWREDIEVCRVVRAAVGNDYPLMLDSTWSYDYGSALRVGRVIDELNFQWFEDPLPGDDIQNYVKLREKIATPIMATEFPYKSLHDFVPWVLARATDYLRGDVQINGGLTPLVKAAHLAEAFHLNFEVHFGGNSLNNFAGLHLSLALPNTEYYEMITPEGFHKYAVINDIEVDGQGLVHAPTAPGLGAEIDFDLIENNAVSELK